MTTLGVVGSLQPEPRSLVSIEGMMPMGLKDLRSKGRAEPAASERNASSAVSPAPQSKSELSESPTKWDEMVALAAMRGAPPAPGSLYSEFEDWASQGALFPSKIETALAIHFWCEWEPQIETGSAPVAASKKVVDEAPRPATPSFGSFG